MPFEIVLLALITVAFATLTQRAAVRYRRRPQRPAVWLAIVFAGMTSAAGGGLGLAAAPDGDTAEDPVVFLLLLVAGIVAYMVALYLFGDALEPVSPVSKRAVVVLSAALLLLIPAAALAGGDAASPGLLVSLIVLLLLWSAVHVVVALAVWRSGGQLSSALARVRARNMVIGVLGMGGALLASFVPGLLAEPGGAEFEAVGEADGDLAIPLGLAALAAVTLSVGFSPPRWLRIAWTQREVDRLVAAELALQRTPTTEVLRRDLLPEVAAVTAATAAWVRYGDSIVAAHGIDPDEAAAITPRTDGDHRVTERAVGGGWVLVAPAGRTALVVHTDEEPVLFGVADLDNLALTAARIGSILDRASLERLEAEARARIAEAQHLERVAALKDDVLSTLSHELRTPLVTLCGVTELLEARWDETEDLRRRQLIGRVRANADALRSVVEDTLELASSRAGEISISDEPIALAAVVAAVLSDSRLGAARRTVVVVMEDGLEVATDRAALARSLRQLVANAIKFGEGRPVTVEASRTGDAVRIAVQDRGAGMTPDEIQRVYEPFYRAGDVLTRGTRGLGVGLTLASETVRRLGGTIEVESDIGTGSRFTLVLPATPGGAIPPPPRDGIADEGSPDT